MGLHSTNWKDRMYGLYLNAITTVSGFKGEGLEASDGISLQRQMVTSASHEDGGTSDVFDGECDSRILHRRTRRQNRKTFLENSFGNWDAGRSM